MGSKVGRFVLLEDSIDHGFAELVRAVPIIYIYMRFAALFPTNKHAANSHQLLCARDFFLGGGLPENRKFANIRQCHSTLLENSSSNASRGSSSLP